MEKMAPDGPKWCREDFLPTNPDLADILGRTDLDFETFYFLFFGSQNSGCSGPQISKFKDFQTPPAAPAPDELSDPNLNPLPTHPGIKYVARALAAISQNSSSSH